MYPVMKRALFILVVALPAFADTDSPTSTYEYSDAVAAFCAQRDELTREAKAASELQTIFALQNAISDHQEKLRHLNQRADELREAASHAVMFALIKIEAGHNDARQHRVWLTQLNAQLEQCAGVDDGFIAWAQQRIQGLRAETTRQETQQTSNEAWDLYIASGVSDPKSLDERVLRITPPTPEQTVDLYLSVNSSRFVFAKKKIDGPDAARAIAAGEALLLVAIKPAKVLTIDGLQLDVDVNALSLTPMKGLKAAPVEPTWLFVSNDDGSGGYRDIHNTWDGNTSLDAPAPWMKLAPPDDADLAAFIVERQRITSCMTKGACAACGCKTFQSKKRAHAKRALEPLQTHAFQPLIPAVARLTGLFPVGR